MKQVAGLVDVHLHLGEGLGLEDLLAVQHQLARLKVDLDLVAVLELAVDLGQVRQDDDGKAAVDGVALVDGAIALGDDGADAQRPEAVHRLLAAGAGAKVHAGQDDVARLRLLGKILPALEVVQGVLAHLLHVGDVQVAVVEDHVGVDVVVQLAGGRGQHPDAALDFLSLSSRSSYASRHRDLAGQGRPGGHRRAGQVVVARPLLAGKVAVAGRDLHLALADHADVAGGAAATAGIADDKAGVEQRLQHAALQHLAIHLAGGRHHRGHHAWRDMLALDHLGDGGEILEAAVGAGADKDRVDPGAGHLAHRLDVVRLGRAGDERLQAGDVDLDLLGVLGVRVGVDGRQVVRGRSAPGRRPAPPPRAGSGR